MAHSARAIPDSLTSRLLDDNGAMGPGETVTYDSELESLRDEVFDLRQRLRTHPVIAQTQGMLVERYRLTGPSAALGLLRAVAQQHDIELLSLATAFLQAPRPAHGRTWFPARPPSPPPPDITFDRSVDPSLLTPSSLLDVLLKAALSCSGTELGNVQLSDPLTETLVLRTQHGFSRDFVDFFAVTDGESSACAAALRKGTRVTVTEVATDPLYDDDARQVILAAGARSVQSTPMLSANGHCIGVYSTHDTLPGRTFSDAESKVLDRLAGQAGAWLDWHHRTAVLDALEHLHQRATVS